MEKYLSFPESVVAGKVLSCKWVKLACERFLYDLQTGLERGLVFIPEAADHVCEFFPENLKHFSGPLAGAPFELEEWQVFIVGQLFGWYTYNGVRRFRTAHLEMPRKNGKTTLAAGIGLYLLDYDDEPESQVYSVAKQRDQAKVAWETAARLFQKNPAMKRRIKKTKTTSTMSVEATASVFRALASDSDSLDGLGPHGVIADETHVWKDHKLWGVLETGTVAREQSLMVEITTAGFNPLSLGAENRQYAEKILEGFKSKSGIKNDSYFAIIYTMDKGDDWKNPKVWAKANPNYNIPGGVNEDKLKNIVIQAEALPRMKREFQCKHLNIWLDAAEKWIDILGDWDACFDSQDIEDFQEKECFIGIDLSKRLDMTAVAYYFPPNKMLGESQHHFFVKCYLPEKNIKKMEEQTKANYSQWVEDGYLTLTPGSVVDYDFIVSDIMKSKELFNIVRISYDPYNATQTVNELQEEGFDMVECLQNFKTMSNASKDFEAIVHSHLLNHGGNPILRWAASNAVLARDANDNYRPHKGKSGSKIDPLIACIIALYASTLGEEEEFDPNIECA